SRHDLAIAVLTPRAATAGSRTLALRGAVLRQPNALAAARAQLASAAAVPVRGVAPSVACGRGVSRASGHCRRRTARGGAAEQRGASKPADGLGPHTGGVAHLSPGLDRLERGAAGLSQVSDGVGQYAG
ncbi:hypothetical protein, partial [Clavibacter michiganensis]|uniref:hypothetical protein n=1 Tax=Clavibacter michiganensis TaxID=28447 RepID=UPI00292E0A16